MSRRLVAAIAVALVVSACTDDREQSPTSPGSSVSPEFLHIGTCNYNDVKKYARNLFGSTGAGYKLAQEMSKYAAETSQATNLGFDIFAAVAQKRAGAVWTDQNLEDAAKLTEQAIYCQDVYLTAGPVDLYDNLFKALTKPTGGYAVRAGKAGALKSGPDDPATSVLTTNSQSGVEPNNLSWPAWLLTRTLVYGYPTEAFPGELTDQIYGTAAYDWSLVRANPLPPITQAQYGGEGKVTLCLTVEVSSLGEAAKFRLQKVETILEVVTAGVSGINCVESTVPTPGPQSFGLSLQNRLVNLAARLVLPTRVYAAAAKTTTSPTGSAGSFSPFQGSNPLATMLDWVYPPDDGTLTSIQSTTPGVPVTVSVTGSNQTPWVGVWLHFYGIDNNGAKGEFPGNCAITNGEGKAEFKNLAGPKTGGFTVFVETKSQVCDPDADASVTGFPPVVLSAPDRIIVRP